MTQTASEMMKETAAKCRASFVGSEIEKSCPELRKILDLAACDLESAATIIYHATEVKTVPTGWDRYDHDDRATWPSAEGFYRVMVSGDNESVDGHTIYDYDDYATWTAADDDEDGDGNECIRFGRGEHAEEPHTFFAYFGPIVVPDYQP